MAAVVGVARRVVLRSGGADARLHWPGRRGLASADRGHPVAMTPWEQELRACGGAARVVSLLAAGATRGQLKGAVRRNALVVVRNGWLALPDAPPEIVRCVAAGGRVGCVSAAAHRGLWTPRDAGLHIALPRHAGRIELPLPEFVRHWSSAPWRANPSAIENIFDVVRQVAGCCEPEFAVAVIDSALNRGLIRMADVEGILAGLPAPISALAHLVDGASESGLESLCRVRLAGLGLPVRTQVPIDDVGRVDLLVGDRLIIELDGRAWHEKSFERDRARDLALTLRGYLVLRLTYRMVESEWPLVQLCVLAIVARGEHLWHQRHRREGLVRPT